MATTDKIQEQPRLNINVGNMLGDLGRRINSFAQRARELTPDDIVHGTGAPTEAQREFMKHADDGTLARMAGVERTAPAAPERVSTPAASSYYGQMTRLANEAERRAYGDDVETTRKRDRANRARRAIAGLTDVLTHTANIWATAKGARPMAVTNHSATVGKRIDAEDNARLKRESARRKAELTADQRDARQDEYNRRDVERENNRREREWRSLIEREDRNVRSAAQRVRTDFNRRVNAADRKHEQMLKAEYNSLKSIWNRPHEKFSEAQRKRLEELHRHFTGAPLGARPTRAPKTGGSKGKKSGSSGGSGDAKPNTAEAVIAAAKERSK